MIKKILFEQDIDVGVDRSLYDPQYRRSQFEKTDFTTTNKEDHEHFFNDKVFFT